MNKEFFGQEPIKETEKEESKYPDAFDPEPEIIYGIELIGGVAKDGSRYKNPRIMDKKKVSEKGEAYILYWVTIKATPIVINDDGNPETPYERKEYTWFVPSQCIAKLYEYYDRKIYKICFQKIARISPETKKSHNDYNVGTQLGDFVMFPSINERIHAIYASKKEETPEPTPQVAPQVGLLPTPLPTQLPEDKTPLDDYNGDDEEAFKEDVKAILKEETHFEKIDRIKREKDILKILQLTMEIHNDNNVTLKMILEVLKKKK